MKQAILVLVAGCGPGSADIADQDPRGHGSDDSSGPGPSDSEETVVWVDADGSVVEEVVELPEGLAFEDEAGFFWALDPNASGSAAFVTFPDAGYARVQYIDAQCTDERILADLVLPPRYVMRGPPDGRSFVAQDGAVPVDVAYIYEAYGDDCVGVLNPAQALTYDEVIEVTLPEADWTAPLHPETL